MKNFLTLLGREVSACWNKPMGYILAALFLSTTGGSFIRTIRANMSEGSPIAIVDSMIGIPGSFVLPAMILVIAGLTMRLLAEEKSTGTIEMLMTAPVTDRQVILSKYAGTMINFTLMLAPTFAFPVILQHNSPGIQLPPPANFVTSYLFIMLLASTFIATGLLVSGLTSNQVVAAIGTLCVIGSLVVLPGLLANRFSQPLIRSYIAPLGPDTQMAPFLKGALETQPFVFHGSLTLLFLFLSTRILETRKWK